VVEVKRKEKEKIESLLRRFKKKLLQSGVLLEARKRRFYERPKSKKQLREEAKRRKELRDEKEYLRKIGKLDSRKYKHTR
jgi:small subunit ribosomal protein S21